MRVVKMSNVFLIVLMLTLMGGIEAKWVAAEEIRPLNLILEDLETHIGELTINIEKIKKRIDFLKSIPSSNDSLIQELRELDLKGWKLHLEQWNVQLKHLQFAEDILEHLQSSPGKRTELKSQWLPHERQYRENLEDYRRQRDQIEEQRLITEGKMFERYFP